MGRDQQTRVPHTKGFGKRVFNVGRADLHRVTPGQRDARFVLQAVGPKQAWVCRRSGFLGSTARSPVPAARIADDRGKDHPETETLMLSRSIANSTIGEGFRGAVCFHEPRLKGESSNSADPEGAAADACKRWNSSTSS